MPVSIVIPSYNGRDLLEQSLPSVLGSIEPNSDTEVIVVDDGSTDDTVPFLRERYPQVRIILLKKNRGFAKASTEGIVRSKNPFVALMNNDVTVAPGFLSSLMSNFAGNDIFAVGSKVLRSRDHAPYHLRSRAILRRGEIEILRDEKEKGETFYVSGGMALFDKGKFSSLGGFDDLYHPFYWEDVDLCYRALKQGYKILYEPESVIYHRDQGTIVHSKQGRGELFLAKMRARIVQERNQYLFTWKNILDRGFIIRHLLWLPVNLMLSLGTRDHIFKPIGFVYALLRLRRALRRRREERKKKYLFNDRQLLGVSG